MNSVPVCVSFPKQFHAPHSPADMPSIRAARFEQALKAYMAAKGNAWTPNGREYLAADMIADALHWCDVNGNDIKFVLSMARSHHESEKLEDARRNATLAPRSAAPPH